MSLLLYQEKRAWQTKNYWHSQATEKWMTSDSQALFLLHKLMPGDHAPAVFGDMGLMRLGFLSSLSSLLLSPLDTCWTRQRLISVTRDTWIRHWLFWWSRNFPVPNSEPLELLPVFQKPLPEFSNQSQIWVGLLIATHDQINKILVGSTWKRWSGTRMHDLVLQNAP